MSDDQKDQKDESVEPDVAFELPKPYQDIGAQILGDENIAVEATPYEPEPEKPLISTDTSAATLAMLRVAESLEKVVTRQEATRQIPYSEIKPVSSFNPTGRRDHPTFKRPTYMDGIPLNSLMHTAEEVELFNKLKAGRYCDRKIEVRRGSAGEIDLVRIGGRIDQRIERSAKFPTLVSMLKTILAERAFKEERRRLGQFDEDEIL